MVVVESPSSGGFLGEKTPPHIHVAIGAITGCLPPPPKDLLTGPASRIPELGTPAELTMQLLSRHHGGRGGPLSALANRDDGDPAKASSVALRRAGSQGVGRAPCARLPCSRLHRLSRTCMPAWARSDVG